MKNLREIKRRFRHERLRRKITGSKERPRLCVHRSLNNFYAQIVDDVSGKVIFGKSTLAKELKPKIKHGGNIAAAALLGEAVAKVAVGKGIKQVSFDRGGYKFHGCVKAFVEAARKGGLEF